jgi:hypothetical protein
MRIFASLACFMVAVDTFRRAGAVPLFFGRNAKAIDIAVAACWAVLAILIGLNGAP